MQKKKEQSLVQNRSKEDDCALQQVPYYCKCIAPEAIKFPKDKKY